MKNLKCTVTNIKLKTPLILASGYITETPDFFLKSRDHGCSAMVTRSLKKNSRGQVTSPRYYVPKGADYMLNAEWGNEHSWENWKNKWVNDVVETNHPLIISLSGRNVDECRDLILIFDRLPVSAFEVNVSCSHSGAIHGNLNVDFEHMKRLLGSIRTATKKPIWIKLSYSPFIVDIAKQVQNDGADAIVATNTIGPGFAIDTKSTKPFLGIKGGCGGVSGKAIFPIALQCVWSLSQELKIPVIGCGGIFTADNVLQMLMAGASAVQLYTAPALKGEGIFKNIIKDLNTYCAENNVKLSEVIGASLKWAKDDHQFAPKFAVVDEDSCNNCGKCYNACVFDAVALQNVAKIDSTKCVGCSACVGICSQACIKLKGD